MKKGVQKIYREVALTYEKINHILTLGMDILWRKKAAAAAAAAGGRLWLDICSGTGELVRYLAGKNGHTNIVCADFSSDMLSISRSRNQSPRIHFVLCDAEHLAFSEGSFDLVTISFATRNIDSNRARLLSHLREFHRALRPGGRFINLETSQPGFPVLKALFHTYIRLTVRPIGTWISGSRAGYSYLARTIPRFYSASELTELLYEAGFSRVEVKKYLFGIAALHTAFKKE